MNCKVVQSCPNLYGHNTIPPHWAPEHCMLHFASIMSFQSKMDQKIFNFILLIIIVDPKMLQRFMFCFVLERFSMKCSNFVNFWARKAFFFFKHVRISTEIDWYHYQSANAAPTAIVRLQIKTDQFWRSVTSEPTAPLVPYPLVLLLPRKFRFGSCCSGGWPSFGWCLTVLGMVGHHPGKLSLSISLVSSIKVTKSESVVDILLVGDHPWVTGWPS